MNIKSPISLMIQINPPRPLSIHVHFSKQPLNAKPPFRHYATHRDRPSSPGGSPSSSTSEVFGRTRGPTLDGQETVGPFPLGVGPSGRNKTWKQWNELGIRGKVGRAARQSGNLGVIIFGGGLFVLLTLSLTTELFAKNSPSVLYSQAVDMIRSSDALNQHLLPPLSFTHTPHASAPVRGTTPVAHRLVRHPTSGRDHMILTFWIHGRGRDDPEPMSWAKDAWGTTVSYAKDAATKVGFLEPDAHLEGTNTDGTKKTAGDGETSGTSRQDSLQVVDKSGEGSWFGKMFGGLTLLRTSDTSKGNGIIRGTPPPGTYKVGEVHGDYVKNAGGQYQLLSLIVDIPSSSASYPGRTVIFKSPEADAEGLLGRIGSRR